VQLHLAYAAGGLAVNKMYSHHAEAAKHRLTQPWVVPNRLLAVTSPTHQTGIGLIEPMILHA
jgi:hypothetical protein